MGDTQQDVKKKGTYEQWTKEESNALLELMVDGATRGWRDNSGIFTKQTVEERILPALNNKLGCHKTYNNYQSRLKWFKKCWTSYNTLFRFSSGFGFDSHTKKFTAPDEVWEDYIKVSFFKNHSTIFFFRITNNSALVYNATLIITLNFSFSRLTLLIPIYAMDHSLIMKTWK